MTSQASEHWMAPALSHQVDDAMTKRGRPRSPTKCFARKAFRSHTQAEHSQQDAYRGRRHSQHKHSTHSRESGGGGILAQLARTAASAHSAKNKVMAINGKKKGSLRSMQSMNSTISAAS